MTSLLTPTFKKLTRLLCAKMEIDDFRSTPLMKALLHHCAQLEKFHYQTSSFPFPKLVHAHLYGDSQTRTGLPFDSQKNVYFSQIFDASVKDIIYFASKNI